MGKEESEGRDQCLGEGAWVGLSFGMRGLCHRGQGDSGVPPELIFKARTGISSPWLPDRCAQRPCKPRLSISRAVRLQGPCVRTFLGQHLPQGEGGGSTGMMMVLEKHHWAPAPGPVSPALWGLGTGPRGGTAAFWGTFTSKVRAGLTKDPFLSFLLFS